MPEAAPSRRFLAPQPPPDAFVGDDGSLMLAAYEGAAEHYWLCLICAGEHGCHRVVPLGFRSAIARCGCARSSTL